MHQLVFIHQKNGYYDNAIDNIKNKLSQKIPHYAYINVFERLQDDTSANSDSLDVNFSGYKIGDTTISSGRNWVNFDFILKYKNTWFTWVRGFTYVFFVIYNANQFMKLLRGFSLSDGSAKSSSNEGSSIKGQISLFK